jgi:uncharacterized protein
MKTLLLLFLVLSGIANAQVEQNNKPKISSVGLGTVSTFPNAAEITISFRHVKLTLREAINDNQKTADEVLRIIRGFVKDTLDVKTSLIATNKSMVWDNKLKREVFVGFESTQRIIFTLKDLKKMQDFTEDLLKTKFNKIELISYFHTKAETFIKQAEELAILDAIETTKRLSAKSGVKSGRIIYIETNKSPNDKSNRAETYEFETYGKGMGGRGVSSSGELIKYNVEVKVYTEIVE